MELRLEIGSATIGGTVEEILNSLSGEDKKQLAKEVMLKVLTEPNDAERKAFEDKVAQEIYEAKKSDSYHRVNSVADARNHYDFRERASKFVSSRERMIQEITKSAIEHYKEQVTELVKADEQLAEMYQQVRTNLVAAFPEILQAIMAQYFASQMGQIGAGLNQAFNAQAGLTMLAQNLKGQLGAQGIQVNL